MIPSVDPVGGGPMEAASKLDSVLQEQGHTVEVVCLDSPTETFLDGYPAKVHALGPARGYMYSSRLVPWLRSNARLFDVVIVDGLWQYHGFAVWRVLAGSATPYIVFTHGMLDPWFKHTYPLKHLKKWLYWLLVEHRFVANAAAVLFTCEEERLLARQSFGLYRAKERVVNFGTALPEGDGDVWRAAFLARFPHLSEKRLFLFLGRIQEKKGCDIAIKAFAAVADQDSALHLVMAGPDQTGWMVELQALAAGLGIADRITWTGMISASVKWGAFHAAEVFVLPSHQENFGIAVAEAMACGLPVLISNKVNIWREIAQDEAGLVDDDTEMATVSVYRQWLALTASERKCMGMRAKTSFQKRFEIQSAAADLLRVCAEVRGGHGG